MKNLQIEILTDLIKRGKVRVDEKSGKVYINGELSTWEELNRYLNSLK